LTHKYKRDTIITEDVSSKSSKNNEKALTFMTDQKKRLKSTLIKYGVIFGIALAYLIFVLCTGLGIPCVFHAITKLECPGCGVTRMLISIVKLDFVSAFWYNPFLFVTGPFLIAYLIACEVKFIKHGNRNMGKWQIFMYVELALALLYGILRNIF
jgi:hypothetical protein